MAASPPPAVSGNPSYPASGVPLRASVRFLWLLPVIIVVADQITKWAIRAQLDLHQSVAVLGDWLRFTYIRNPGGAFGLRWGHDAVYYGAALVVIAWIIWQLMRHGHTRRLSVWALALILGGAVGNLIDRVAFSEVTDFIDVEFFDLYVPAFDFGIIRHPGYLLDRWPAFNIADSAVTTGLVALLVTLWRDPTLGRRRAGQPETVAPAAADIPADLPDPLPPPPDHETPT
ncbi:MAG TPA: signal peptidase II [Acidobacteriota bacterium]|nr:signal peptidase II [Acidobacteriota bacterium]